MPTKIAAGLAPRQRVLAEGKFATVLADDHPFAAWCRSHGTSAGLVCVQLDRQDMHGSEWKPIRGVRRFTPVPHKFRVYPPSLVKPLAENAA